VGGEHDGNFEIGMWVLTGLLTFMIIEKIFPESAEDENSEDLNSAVSIFRYFLFYVKQLIAVLNVLLQALCDVIIQLRLIFI